MFSEVHHPEAIDQAGVRLQAGHLHGNEEDQNHFSTQAWTSSREKGGLMAEMQLIQSAVTGDLPAFNHLVAVYQDSLYRWVCSLLKDEAIAEDITQSTFIAAFEKLQSFRGGSFQAWLFTIARNRSYDELRRMKHYPVVRLDDGSEDFQDDRLALIPDSAALPEDALMAVEEAANLEHLLTSLPDVFQQVIRLIDMEGMDYQAAADILGLPLGTVKSRLARARLKMRHLFQVNRLL